LNAVHDADVVIVGGGIAGTSSAWHLARRGLRVVLCEKGVVGGEQSTRNWGFVRQQGRDPAELPLMMESNAIWRRLERELNADLEWIQGGNLVTFATEHERDRWGEWAALAARHGLDTRVLERREIERVVPGHRMDVLGAVYTPGDGQAEPRRVMPALRRAAQGCGALVRERCAVFAIDVEAGAIAGVTTEQGRIRAPVVVCAGGVWSSRLLRFAGLELPSVWVRGSVARTTPVPLVSHAATWSGVAFRQRRDGSMNVATRSADHDLTVDSLLDGARFMGQFRRNRRDLRVHLRRLFLDTLARRFSQDAFACELTRLRTLDPEPNHATLARVLTEVRRVLPGAGDARIERSWAGYIDMTPDMLPVIDRLECPSGLVLATGLSGHGFGMGPIVGRLVSELVLEGRASMDLGAFRFARFHDGSALVPHSVV
jgi:glycine/D-amino acid oxidase-like deaminating enzyme